VKENIGEEHVAYFANNNVTGQSEINRIVQHFAKIRQIQERLSVQIAEKLKEIFETDNVPSVIDAKHLPRNIRGVRDRKISVITFLCSGLYNESDNKEEFLKQISLDSKIDL
jgi:GTP cyclohydrolase I